MRRSYQMRCRPNKRGKDRSKRIFIVFRVSGLILLTGLFLVQPGGSLAGDSEKGLVRSAIMNIMGKAYDAVVISERNFMVSESTVILDQDGQEIGLKDLPVPCTADIRYELIMDKSPLCLSIHVIKLHKGARRDWSSSDYEDTR